MMRDDADLLAFADVLLPGDEVFPAASATGILTMAVRLPAGLAGRLAGLSAMEPAGRIGFVTTFAGAEPGLFLAAQKALYLAYYEQPEAIAAIRAMGFTYHAAPLPEGYPLAPFDPAIDTPRHGRGHWVPTDAVKPLDLSPLPFLKA